MRGRAYAIAISMAAAALPLLGWLSTVIVALVCLRSGIAAGSVVFLWTLLPFGVAFYFVGDPSPMIALLGTFMMAMLLRQTVSWELVLVASVVVSAVGALIFELNAVAILDRFVQFYIGYLEQLDASVVIEPEQARKLLMSFFALGQAFSMVVMLMIARWCQSALYNPGEFGKEFHQLRLSPAVSGCIVFAMAVCFMFGDQLGRWLPLLTVPLVFASIGLVHWLIANKELSKNWVAGFYGSLALLFQIVYPFLASFALMDSWFDIRKRIETIQKD
jgi:hypothetical protein